MGAQTGRTTQAAVAIAEVITSSITGFQAECLSAKDKQPDFAPKPRFGSFLKVQSQECSVFGVVFNVITGPQDNVHKPTALGLTREELRLEQPQIFSLLKTEVHALLIGYESGGEIYQHLPPHPPDVHDFVFYASADEIAGLTHNLEFLPLLLHVNEVPSDELVAAAVREAHLALGSDDQFLIEAGRMISNLFRSDYDRLLTILKKIKPDRR